MLIQNKNSFSYKDLFQLEKPFTQPFLLSLKDNDFIECEKILKLIPQDRMVVTGTWRDKDIIAKLFFHPDNAHSSLEKELSGIKFLQDNKVPTPEILQTSMTEDERVHILLFEYIMDAKPFHQIWQERKDDPSLLPQVKSIVVEIATQHVLGLQNDTLHFNDFLLTDKTIYTLDGGRYQQFPFLLPRKPSMKNLALFLSQLGAGTEKLQETLFQYYAKARGWTIHLQDKVEISFLIKQWNQIRSKKFENMIGMDNTEFFRIKNWKFSGMVDREYLGPELKHFLSQPDSLFNQIHGHLLKNGDSTTVKKVTLDQRHYVIKRYNLTGFMHRLRRCLQPTRARKSWQMAHKLGLFYIETAKPVAYIEKCILGFHGNSYLITEYISDENAAAYYLRCMNQPQIISDLVKNITRLIKKLFSIEMTHGDLKITNILIDHKKQPVLIDLDGTTEHFSWSGLYRESRKDWQRFLRNFNINPALQKKFEEEFNQ